MRRRWLVTGGVGLLLALLAWQGYSDDREGALRTPSYLPQDAAYAGAMRMDNLAVLFDGVLEVVDQFVPQEETAKLHAGLQAWEEQVGLSLRDDLLAEIGGEAGFAISVDDLDRFGLLAMSAEAGAPPEVEAMLGGFLYAFGVEDPERFDAALGKLLDSTGEATLRAGDDGARTVYFMFQGEERTLLHYRHHLGHAVLGFSTDAVEAAITRAELGNGLPAAPDYQAVFSHLDPEPDSLAYMNLPRVRELLITSNLLQAAIAAEPEAQKIYTEMVVELEWNAGIGWASYTVEGGTVIQTFMPFSLAAMARGYLGLVSAVAAPNLLSAVDRGKQTRTMMDMRSIATGLEAYAVDHSRYPENVPTDTPVGGGDESNLERWLVPVYLQEMPTVDAWGGPFLYRSDASGMEYWITSYGQDGVRSPETHGMTQDFDCDIVYRNGNFVAWPEDTQD